jgi:ABC-2 type transport system ATP-binding protein
VRADADGSALRVTGLTCAALSEATMSAGIPVHELTPREASLEDAYMELTRQHVEFRTNDPSAAAARDTEI